LAAPLAPSHATRRVPGIRSALTRLHFPKTRKLRPSGFPAGTAPHARALVAGRPEAAINPAPGREISVSVRLGRTTVTPSRSGRCSVSSSSSCIPPPKTVRQRRNVSARAPSRVKLSRYKQAKLNSQNLLNITIQARGVNREPEIKHESHQGTQRETTPAPLGDPSCPLRSNTFMAAHAPSIKSLLTLGFSAGGSRCARDFACGLPLPYGCASGRSRLQSGSSCRKSHQLLH
jgi:hypothetical protein